MQWRPILGWLVPRYTLHAACSLQSIHHLFVNTCGYRHAAEAVRYKHKHASTITFKSNIHVGIIYNLLRQRVQNVIKRGNVMGSPHFSVTDAMASDDN